MLAKKLIVKLNKTRNVQYSLSKKTRKTYFTFNSKLIGTSDDILRVTRKVIDSYLKKGLFVTLALQKIEKDEDRTDLIAYSYDTEKSISVEIKSTSELLSHPEHTIYNMRSGKRWDLICVIHGLQVRNYKKFTINRLVIQRMSRCLLFKYSNHQVG